MHRLIFACALAVVFTAGLARGQAPVPTFAQGLLGLTMQRVDGGFAVSALVPCSPAQSAGLKRGDVITAVDGQACGIDVAWDAVEKHFAGLPGSLCRLSVKRGATQLVLAIPRARRRQLYPPQAQAVVWTERREFWTVADRQWLQLGEFAVQDGKLHARLLTLRALGDTPTEQHLAQPLAGDVTALTVGACVLRVLGRIHYQKPLNGSCVIQWPFVFSPG